MFALMMRNISSDGFVFADPVDPSRVSAPGCIIAAPTYPANAPGVNQDYVFNWTRDAAITAMELAAARLPTRPGVGVQPLIDYVRFAKTCQDNASPTLAHACFTIEGDPRPWTEQSDGPALQTLAILDAYPQLDDLSRAVAAQVIAANLAFLLKAYRDQTTNLWEEHQGYSFFARAVQLRCFREISTNTQGLGVPAGTSDAITWLQDALSEHWDANASRYVSLIGFHGQQDPAGPGYDPNSDIVMAAVYGGIAVDDTRLLSTAAQLRAQWSNANSPSVYPINIADRAQNLGPLLGRYPADSYDGDTSAPVLGGHPWALCTSNFAELYYRLATQIAASGSVPYDSLSAPFFAQIGVDASTTPATVADSLTQAGDAMLHSVIYHSDNLELSEQFDGSTGYEKSVRDLTWSYAAFLSAVRARTGQPVQG
jgi:glucoamylase